MPPIINLTHATLYWYFSAIIKPELSSQSVSPLVSVSCRSIRYFFIEGKARARAGLRQGMVKSNLALFLPVQLHVHVVWREHAYAWGNSYIPNT